jgi:hypothetical protein
MPELAGGELLEELFWQRVKLLPLVLTAKVGTKTLPFATVGSAYETEHHTSVLAYTFANVVDVLPRAVNAYSVPKPRCAPALEAALGATAQTSAST